MVETACLKFIGDVCAQATYRLEGDSFLLVSLTEEIDAIAQHFSAFLTTGEIPRKAYDTRDFDTLDVGDPGAGIMPPIPDKGRLEDFLRDCGYANDIEGPGVKKSKCVTLDNFTKTSLITSLHLSVSLSLFLSVSLSLSLSLSLSFLSSSLLQTFPHCPPSSRQ